MGRLFVACVALALTAALFPAPAPALDSGNVALVEYTNDDFVGEMCSMLPDCRLLTISRLFYHDSVTDLSKWIHNDIYDAIFVFDLGTSTVQQGWTVYHPPNPQKGIGRDYKWDDRTRFGIPGGRLRIAVNMGTLGTLPDNPDDQAKAIIFPPVFPLTGAELMGHEFGHYWLASITYKKDGVTHCWIRGNECSGVEGCTDGFDKCDGYNSDKFNQHWSYYFNSESVMYGSFITDNKDGTFTFRYETCGFSHLDQYLMGLRSAEQVQQELFIVDTSSDGDPVWGSGSLPMQHHSTPPPQAGKRINFTMNDIIASVGVRDPERDACHWKAAFILAYPQTNPPTQGQIKKVDDYRKRWETWYDWATSNRGSFDTTLNNHGPGTPTCPAPNYPDGGYPDDDASVDGGGGDAGKQDAGTADGGGKDGGGADGASADGSQDSDSGTGDDAEVFDDGAYGPDSGKKKDGGSTPVDLPAGCSCASLGV
jgi:hypothetical protein